MGRDEILSKIAKSARAYVILGFILGIGGLVVNLYRGIVGQLTEIIVNVFVALDSDAALVEMRLDIAVDASVVDEKDGSLLANYHKRPEQRAEVDVGGAEVEQPRDFVETCQDLVRRAVFLAEVGDFGRRRESGIFVVKDANI